MVSSQEEILVQASVCGINETEAQQVEAPNERQENQFEIRAPEHAAHRCSLSLSKTGSMKILTDNIAKSILGGMALMSGGVIVAEVLALLQRNGEISESVLGVVLFPVSLSADLWDGPGPYRTVVGFLALAVTLSFWSSLAHGLRMLARRRL